MRDSAPRTVLLAHPGAELYGSDRMLLETIAGLAERGWRVVLTVPGDGPLVREAQLAGARVVLLDVPVLRKRMLRPAALAAAGAHAPGALRRMRALLREVRPDVVYVSTLTLPLWIAVARLRRVPVVCHVHESERSAARPLREALALPLRLANTVLVNSAFSRASLADVAPALAGRSAVVMNGVPGPPLPSSPRPRVEGPLRIAYVGRLSPRKGPDVVIDALSLLRGHGIDASLDLIGSTFDDYEWYERQLHEQVAGLGLTDRVRFLGFEPTVWQRLHDADVAVVPSREEEPFGNTAVEAILAARPVVVSHIGGLPEAVDGIASAMSVLPDDPAALADALRIVALDWPTFRQAAIEAAPRAAERYAPSRYRTQVAGAIERAAAVTHGEAVSA